MTAHRMATDAALIGRWEMRLDQGWQFLYLGANQDAIATAPEPTLED